MIYPIVSPFYSLLPMMLLVWSDEKHVSPRIETLIPPLIASNPQPNFSLSQENYGLGTITGTVHSILG